MTENPATAAPGMSVRSQLGIGLMLLLGALALAWAGFLWQIRGQWSSEGYYAYGWFVPGLAIYLLYLRAERRPLPGPGSPVALVLGIALALLVLPFLRFLNEAGTEWRLLIWSQALLLTGITFLILRGIGGWRWVWHFAFPVLFILTAIPWPTDIEMRLVLGLTDRVVDFTVEALRVVMGLPATFTGNHIDVGGQIVVVGDVCSGIRSLQALVMVGLFFGENFRRGWLGRLTLVAGAALFAFVFNCLRALALALIVLHYDTETFDAWHDHVGTIAFLASCLGLFLLSEGLNRLHPKKDAKPDVNPSLPRPPIAYGATFLAGIAAMMVVIEGWYRLHSPAGEGKPAWTVHWPEEDPMGFFERLEMPEDVSTMLQFDDGQRANVYTETGKRMEVYHLLWYSGQGGLLAAGHHTPEICMVRVGGATLLDRTEGYRLETATTPLRFTAYSLQMGRAEEIVHVFRTVSGFTGDDANTQSFDQLIASKNRAEYFAAVWNRAAHGRRHFPTQLLLVGVSGALSADEAWEAMSGYFESRIVDPDLVPAPKIAVR